MPLKLPKNKQKGKSHAGAARIEAARPEIRDTIDELLYSGETPYTITTRIKEDWSDFDNVVDRTIQRNIESYSKTQACKDRLAKLEEVAAAKDIKRFDKQVSVLQDLQWTTMLQRARLEKAYEREKVSPLPLESVSKELMNYQRLLTETGRMQLEIGVLQKAPKKVTGIVAGVDGRPQTFSWTEEHEALLAVLDDVEAD